ncbi:UNVERIFIED_CONTAM: hypothetical protein GTU68_029509, partial [Idotea baltica]|nr:hypothetical protein [Idotea baltica]
MLEKQPPPNGYFTILVNLTKSEKYTMEMPLWIGW